MVYLLKLQFRTALGQMRQINPINNHGSIQLKFSVGGKRYSFAPIPGGDYNNARDIATAKAIATKISNDIISGYFDPTLDRYRLSSNKKSETIDKSLGIDNTEAISTRGYSFINIWDAWVLTLELPAATRADHYEMIRRMIVRANPALNDTQWLTSADIASSTYNKRLSYIKRCCEWAIIEGHLESNAFADLKPRKSDKPEVRPFTTTEIQAILKGFTDLAPQYRTFVSFLFLTGTRLSEAIGLQWQNVEFDRNEVVIRESLSKDRTSNGYKRLRKKTKTGSIRYLTLSEPLRNLLLSIRDLKPDAEPTSLVFTSPKGSHIDSGNFRSIWVKVLSAVDVPYRKIHTIRHTMISHAIDQGVSLTGVAYLAGHKDSRMIVSTYSHIINRPSLPDMPL